MCPDCSTRWRYQRTQDIVERLASFRRVRLGGYRATEKGREPFYVPIRKFKKLKHITVSLGPEISAKMEKAKTIRGLRRMFHKAEKLALGKGVEGGVIIFHPFRLVEELKPELQAIAAEKFKWAPGEFGLWKALVKLPNWRRYCVFAPHFHIIASYPRSRKLVQGNAEDIEAGFLFKGISNINSIEEIVKCSMYQLSHAGVLSPFGAHTVRWFGKLSTRNWSFERAPEEIQKELLKIIDRATGNFSEAEGEPSARGRCECGSPLTEIENIPNIIEKFSPEGQLRLKVAYFSRKTRKPPPRNISDIEKAHEWLRGLEAKAVGWWAERYGLESAIPQHERKKVEFVRDNAVPGACEVSEVAMDRARRSYEARHRKQKHLEDFPPAVEVPLSPVWSGPEVLNNSTEDRV